MIENNSKMQVLDEAWGILPTSLSVVDNIEGQDLYSSSKVKGKFVEAIMKQKILAPVYKKMENLIERQIVIPCFASKNFISFLSHKFFSDQLSKSILGFFYAPKNKLYVLLDNQTKFIVFMSNTELSSVTMHELQHYAAWNLKAKFYNINKNIFRTYFNYFYNLQFNVNAPASVIDNLVEHCFENFELKKDPSTTFLTKFADVLFNQLRDLIPDDEVREKAITKMLAIEKIYLTDPSAFVESVQQGDPDVKELVINLHRSYSSLGIKDPRSLTIQELLYPSEIIAIQGQHKPSDNHYISIKAL